jgi:hypothetical protein
MRRSGIFGVLVAVVVLSGPAGAAAATRGANKNSSSGAPPVTVLPVISCPTSLAGGTNPNPFVARQLPTSSPGRGLTFYSNGLITVLGPAGWACGALVAGDGGQKLDVYPPGSPDYSTSLAPKGATLIEVTAEYTGHLPGAEVVCALFPHSAAAADVKSGGLPCPTAAREKRKIVTPDVVEFSDPAGVTGVGAGSGGKLKSSGAAVYPQLPFGSDTSVNVSLLSCTLPKKSAAACGAILGDFLVRNQPSYTGFQYG